MLSQPEFDRQKALFYEKTDEKNYKLDSNKKGFLKAKKCLKFFSKSRIETEPKYTLNFATSDFSKIISPPAAIRTVPGFSVYSERQKTFEDNSLDVMTSKSPSQELFENQNTCKRSKSDHKFKYFLKANHSRSRT